MSEDRVVVRVSKETAKVLTAFAKAKEFSTSEAADSLIATGKARLDALARYSKTAEKKPAKKRAKKAKAD